MNGDVAAFGGVTIHRLIDLEATGGDSLLLHAGIVRIFKATASRWPADPAAARAFQDLWLEQYLRHERELAYVAIAAVRDREPPSVVGYLVGCRVDPLTSSRFDSLSYFKAFAAECALFPAHLHINLDAAYRGQRLGERLVETLCDALAAEGVPGVHVVTGREQRNIGFYKRIGFLEMAATPRGSSEVVFLGRRLGPRQR